MLIHLTIIFIASTFRWFGENGLKKLEKEEEEGEINRIFCRFDE